MTKVVILVGGPSKGTRFRPLSFDLPKPLFPIAGKPILLHQLESCARLSQLEEVLVVGFEKEPEWDSFIAESSLALRVPVRFLDEGRPLGTAGALQRFSEDILRGSPKHIIVIHCDVLCSYNLNELLMFHKSHEGCVATLLATKNRESPQSFGCIKRDKETSEMLHYVEKPASYISHTINAGIYVFSPSIFDLINEVAVKEQQSPYGEHMLFLEQSVFPKLAGRGRAFVCLQQSGFWVQIKSPADALRATEVALLYYAQTNPTKLVACSESIRGNVVVEKSAAIDPTALVGPNVYIGHNVHIGAGVRVANAIVLDGSEVRDHAYVYCAVIGRRSVIGMWARVEGVGSAAPHSAQPREGVTIIGGGTIVHNEKLVRNCVVLPHKRIEQNYVDEIVL
eukprot:m51a1_g6056 putative mannose-1-phosphate guanylyltransferase (395) ;mRNA; f:230440-232399